MIIGISKEDLEERLKMNLEFYDEDDPTISTLKWLIGSCIELHPIPEYKELPQAVFAQEGTVINITDGDNRGKWVSTKEGWIRYYPQCRQPNNLTPAQKHQAPI